jgi:hypothetical protein
VASEINLQGLIDLARLYSDQRPGGANAFVPDTGSGSVTTLINGAIAELYDLLVASGGHEYYVKDATIAIVPGTSVYDMPADFYQAQTLHLPWASDDWEYIAPFEQAERMRLMNFQTWGRRTPKGYRIRGQQSLVSGSTLTSQVEFLPVPTTTIGCTLRYVPAFTPLSNLTTDFFTTVNSWQKIIAMKAAIELRAVAKLDASDLKELYSEQRDRVQEMADKRAQGATPQIVDIDAYRQFPEWAADRRWI